MSIRPGVSVLTVLRHLNYRPWYALAEFVDNALQSFLTSQDALSAGGKSRGRLTVQITLSEDGSKLTIKDDAAGIAPADYARAFRPAALPPDSGGLSEFGMGMKSAACWFAPRWTVTTSALGEPVERTVAFDIGKIVHDEIDELEVVSRSADARAHYTSITLLDLYKTPKTRTIDKIRSHLASIYRTFLRDGILELRFNGDSLSYESPEVLTAPFYADSGGRAVEWRKEISFDFGIGLRAYGFAALRAKASVSEAGFALFRRGRLIEGSGEDGYRPEFIFGKSNSYRWQRLFGELHLEGFEVSHTKDGFVWEENEEAFLSLLKEHLDADPTPLLTQAEEYRARASRKEIESAVELATKRTAAAIERDVPSVVAELRGRPVAGPPVEQMPDVPLVTHRTIEIPFRGVLWRILLELSDAMDPQHWIEVSDAEFADDVRGELVRQVGIRLSLPHPFTQRFAGTGASAIEPLVRIAAAIGLAEAAARDAGAEGTATIRQNVNELVRALANP